MHTVTIRRSLATRAALCGFLGLAVALTWAIPTVRAVTVRAEYTGIVATASGSPLGISSSYGQPISGIFQYDTDTPDADPFNSVEYGRYIHTVGTGGFSLNVEGHAISNSDTPVFEIFDNNLQGLLVDQLQFEDGADTNGGTMRVDGVLNADAWVRLIISTQTLTYTTSDALPETFPFDTDDVSGFLPPAQVTYILGDDSSHDRLLFQFTLLEQVAVPPPIPGDANGDGVVDAADLARVLANWSTGDTYATGDFNDDDTVDRADLTFLFGNVPDAATAGQFASVPEPSTLLLASLGLYGLIGAGRTRRSKRYPR